MQGLKGVPSIRVTLRRSCVSRFVDMPRGHMACARAVMKKMDFAELIAAAQLLRRRIPRDDGLHRTIFPHQFRQLTAVPSSKLADEGRAMGWQLGTGR